MQVVDLYHKCTMYFFKNANCLSFASTWIPPTFFMAIVLLNYLVLYVVLSCVFSFLVRWFNVRYNFCIGTIFGLSLPCRMPNKRQELITLREHSIGRDPHLFGFLCWFFLFCLSPSCALCPQC
jgi:hypothetical protein